MVMEAILSSNYFLIINEVDIAFIKLQELEYQDILIEKETEQ